MVINNRDTDDNVFVIAEIGNNHEGDFILARDMISRAAESGVDAVKFQTFIPEQYVTSNDSERLDRLRRFRLNQQQLQELNQHAAKCELVFFSTPFDIASAIFLNSLQPLFKISSGDNTFFPLIETIAGFDKPTLISTGLADLDLLDSLYRMWSSKAETYNLAFLHCVSSYPVPSDQANLGAIATLRSHYPDVTIGYSDHTIGIDAAIYAVAAGARIVEKHFTLDKNYSNFRDHQLSADPTDMKTLVKKIRQLELLLGTGEKKAQPCEADMRVVMRRSIAGARVISAGSILSLEDLTWVRPGGGFSPGDEEYLVGRAVNCEVHQGEIIYPEMLSN
jgi:N,N'-diacetyllegionaminate synthase